MVVYGMVYGRLFWVVERCPGIWDECIATMLDA